MIYCVHCAACAHIDIVVGSAKKKRWNTEFGERKVNYGKLIKLWNPHRIKHMQPLQTNWNETERDSRINIENHIWKKNNTQRLKRNEYYY